MERQIPKNVRQIGNVSDTPKIYVEDYVDTFFTQLCEKTGEVPIGAFLVGDMQKSDEEEYVYIYGAIQMHELKFSGREYIIDEDTWKRAYEDCKQYFEDGEMLGWFVAHAGVPLSPEDDTVKLHKKSFPKENTIFIMKDPGEKDEIYYASKFGDLMEIGGHYTYYEKNPCMQNYMISTRKKNGASPSETVEDRVAKDFRSIIRSREEQMQKQRASRAMYVLSACLVLMVLIMGVATMNNFDKMKSVQSSLDTLSDSVSTKDFSETKEQDKSSGTEELQSGGEPTTGEAEQTTEGNPDLQGDAGNETESTAANHSGSEGFPAEGAAVETGGNVVSEGVPDTGNASTTVPENNGSDGIYVVEQGDTLAIISQKVYGDISHVDAICRMNGMTDGNLIYIGQKLLLP